ncbi:glycosyltransferase [Imhoffiella purpurea]|uniref:glycosyltransferase n=1 Tax=Imhoffiella purpurea TaxID=1249627 RepID=UPI0005C15596|nr:glycosyltransferase [Imhoffiella purpurea]
MKSTHVVPAISEEASGPSYSVIRLCESLIAEGLSLNLAILDDGPLSPQRLYPYVHSFPLGFGPRRLGHSDAMYQWLKLQAAAGSIDVLHNHSLWMMPNIYPGRVAEKYQVPLVVSPRGTLSAWAMRSGSRVKRVFWPLVQRRALEPTTCFHATAKAEYQDIRRAGFMQPVAIIPNGVDIPTLRDHDRDGFRTVLFLGRIHPGKGVDLLLSAWQVVCQRHPDWQLKIVGPVHGEYRRRMEALAIKLRLPRLTFSGPLYGAAKMDAYQQADVFVLPSLSENFGMVVAEALASATPVIVSKGAPWAGLERERAGWWIDIGLAPLIASLDHVMQMTRSDLRIMGNKGRHWMQRDYSWERIGRQMRETYEWMYSWSNRPSWVIED